MENLSLHLGHGTDARLIYPMAAMFFLSLTVLIIGFRTRIQAVRSRKVKISYFRTYSTGEVDEGVLKTSRHFSNLFEAPVLYYTAVLAAMILGMHSLFFLLLAWFYVFARIGHAAIHMGSNRLYPRMTAYAVSWIFLLAMWLQLMIHAAG